MNLDVRGDVQGPATGLLPREHRGLLVAFLVVVAVDLLGEAAGILALQWIAKPLIIPLLLAWVLAVRRSTAPRPLTVGLVLAWLGDLALMLDGTVAFMLGLLMFLGMQISYIVGFVRLGSVARLRARPWIPAAAVLLWIGLNVSLGPMLGELRIPIAVYSLALTTMAALACGVSARVGVGGVVFLVSDLLIGLGAADLDIPAGGVLVMATYALGQLLIVTGWLRRSPSHP